MPSCAVSKPLVFYPCNSVLTRLLSRSPRRCVVASGRLRLSRKRHPHNLLAFCDASDLCCSFAPLPTWFSTSPPLSFFQKRLGLCCVVLSTRAAYHPSRALPGLARPLASFLLLLEASCHCVPFMRYHLTRSVVRLSCGPSQWTLACAARTLWPSTHGLSSLSS